MGLYYGNNRVGGIYFGTLGSGGTPITLATPTLSLASATGVVTATVTQSTSGYLSSGSTSATLNLSTQTGREITPSTATQTAVAAGKYTLGAITVKPIPSNYIIPSGTLDITTNGTHTVTNYASVSVNVPTQSGSSVSLETATRTYTPTESSQTETITPSSGYDGLSSVGITINAISSTYVGSGITRRSSTDLSASGDTVTVPSGYYASQATKSVAAMTLPPAASNSSSGTSKATITPSTSNKYINIPTGYNSTASYYTISGDADLVASNIKSGVQIFGVTGTYTASGGGIDTSDATATAADLLSGKTAYAGGSKITGTIATKTSSDLTASGATVSVPAGYYATAASKSIANGSEGAYSTTNSKGTYMSYTIQYPNVTPGYFSSISSKTINLFLDNEIVTPSAAEQVIMPANNNHYLNSVTINGDDNLIAANIKSGVNIFGVAGTYTGEAGLDTSDATATAADLLYNKTAYVGGSKITGTMPNNGATGGTITTQGGTYTIPAGYTSGGTVTANLATGSTTAANISGAAFEESTGDYGFRASVQIQPGYYSSATTITKEFSTILPAPETEGTSAQVLAGYDLYNHDGQVISGTMTNNSIGTITLDQTTTSYTIPAGYHNGTGKVQHTTVDIPDPTISINSSTGVITASGSWTRGFTTDNSYSKTYNLTTLGDTTYNVSTSNQTISSGRYLTGNQTIRAVTTSNITAANIKVGVTVQVGDSADADRILGVTGTFTSDANATAADINSGATAYVNGSKITGTQTFSTIHTGSSAPSSSLGSNGDVYLVLA